MSRRWLGIIGRGRIKLIGGLAVLTLIAGSTQIGRSPAVRTPETERHRAIKIGIVAISDKPANPQEGVVLDQLQEGRGVDVVLSSESVSNEDSVWLLVRPPEAEAYRVFGPAKAQRQEGREIWVVPDVILPHAGAIEGKHFLMRAAILPKDQDPGTSVESLEKFPVISWPPVPVAVLKWKANADKLAITTIGGQMLDTSAPLAVGRSADVEGTRQRNGPGKIYIVLHPVNTDLWRVVGPAEVKDSRWHRRDVPFIEPDDPRWHAMDVFAVQSADALQPGPIEYHALLERNRTTSDSIRVWIKDDSALSPQQLPKVEITRYYTPDGKRQAIGKEQDGIIKLPGKAVEFSLEGSVQSLPRGKTIRAILNPVDTPLWIVPEEKALITGNDWILPGVRLAALVEKPATRYRLFVAVVDETLRAGVVDSLTWQNQSLGRSPMLFIEREAEPADVPSETGPVAAPAIVSVAGYAVAASDEVRVASRGPVVVRAENIPQGAQVWVGKNESGRDDWEFFPTIHSSPETWMTSGIIFKDASLGNHDEESGGETATVIALVTRASLPAHVSDFTSWRLYPSAVSPLVKVIHVSHRSQTVIGGMADGLSAISAFFTDGEGASVPTWLWVTLALSVLLVLLALAQRTVRLPLRAVTVIGGPDALVQGGWQGRTADRSRSPSIRLGGIMLILGLLLFFLMSYSLIPILLGLAVVTGLVMLGRRFPLFFSLAASETRKSCEQAIPYLRGQMPWIPKPDMGDSVLGLLLLGLGIFAIVSYFPIYEHILRTSLQLNQEQGHSLALLIIIFIGLTGLMADITTRYGRRKHQARVEQEGEEPRAAALLADEESGPSGKNEAGSFLYFFSVSLVMIFAAALLVFQGILYFEFYEGRAAEGSHIPVAFGISALFFAGVEMLNFYWGMRLSLDFIAWLIFHVVLLVPLSLLGRMASLIEQVFAAYRDAPPPGRESASRHDSEEKTPTPGAESVVRRPADSEPGKSPSDQSSATRE